MAISISAGGGLEAFLGSSGLEVAGADGAAAEVGAGVAFPASQVASQSSFEPPPQQGVRGKQPSSWTLDTSNLDNVAPPSEQPCALGVAGMTSNPGQMLERQLGNKGVADLLSQLPTSQGGGSAADIARQLMPDQRTQLVGANAALGQLYDNAFGNAQDSAGAHPCVDPNASKPVTAAKPTPPPDPAELLEADPLITAKEASLRSSMLTPRENKGGKGSLATAQERFELLPSLTSKQQAQFEKNPSARADIVAAFQQKQYEADPDAAMNKIFKKADESVPLKEGTLIESGHGDFLQKMQRSDDVYGGAERSFTYQGQLDMAVGVFATDLPERDGRLGSQEVNNEVKRVLGPRAAADLSSMTPLQQATTYSQAAQVDLMRAPLGATEQLVSETQENFMRDYTYLGADKVQHYSDLNPRDRTLLNREATVDQLYRQTSNAGTDWDAALTADVYTRNAKQQDLNAAQLTRQPVPVIHGGFPSPFGALNLPPSFWTTASPKSATTAPPPQGTVPAQNGAPAVRDQFKAYVQNKGIDVSNWDTMSRTEKAEAVKAAYLLNLTGDALAGVPIRP